MKIGFLGNANSYPFMLAKALRRLGHEVLFVIDRAELLNRPENRYDEFNPPYPDWIYDASPVDWWSDPQTFFELIKIGFCSICPPRASDIVKRLKGCDFVILNQYGPSLAPFIGRPSFAMLTGTDLQQLANFRAFSSELDKIGSTLNPKSLLIKLVYTKFVRRLIDLQRQGIRDSVAVSYFARGLLPEADSLLEEIGVQDSQRVFILMTDLEKIPLEPLPQNSITRLFNVSRLTWKKPLPPEPVIELDYKGTDVMIRGIGLFWRKTGISLDIRLVKKGAHVAETMQLINDEGLSGQVTWLEEMSQVEVLNEYRNADIVFDQLGMGMIGMGTLDAMAMGRPVIANGRPEIVEPFTGVISPLCQAVTAEEVCLHLEYLVPERKVREQVGIDSRVYVEKYFSAESAATICLERMQQALTAMN